MSPLRWATRRKVAAASTPAAVRPAPDVTHREASSAMASAGLGSMRAIAAQTDPAAGEPSRLRGASRWFRWRVGSALPPSSRRALGSPRRSPRLRGRHSSSS